MKHRMRPHHLFCGRFIPKYFGERRGKKYRELESFMIATISFGNQDEVEMIMGPDELCPACEDYEDGRCASPEGNEDEVRKWDAIIVKALGVPYGTVMKGGEWWELSEKIRPLAFCPRCSLRKDCVMPKEPPLDHRGGAHPPAK
jgi:hypothetical protein